MKTEQPTENFKETLATRIEGVLAPGVCAEMVARYEHSLDGGDLDATIEGIVEECRDRVFSEEVDGLLRDYYQSEYQALWPRLDVVDSSAIKHYVSALWHLDHGVPKSLKLFVYLNAVAEHGGNTLIIDAKRSEALKRAGELPVGAEGRKEDLTAVLEGLGLDPGYQAFDLKAGDVLLFSPIVLAHRCLPPRAGQKRYTVCFTIAPPF